jgi:lactocepin
MKGRHTKKVTKWGIALLLASMFAMQMVAQAGASVPGSNRPAEAAHGFEVQNLTGQVKPTTEKDRLAYAHSRPTEVWAVVETGDSLLGTYLAAPKGYAAFSDYAAHERLSAGVVSAKARVKQNLYRDFTVYDEKYDYTAILNGFAVKVNRDDVAAIRNQPGVTRVTVSERYAAPDTPVNTTNAFAGAATNDVNVYETGIYDGHESGYTGSGTLAAVLDTGIDYTHAAFSVMPSNPYFTEDLVGARMPGMLIAGSYAPSDVYRNAKIPFSFDYADNDANAYPLEAHGTHVAAIIAGNGGMVDAGSGEIPFVGVAPQAQLAIYKVFSNDEQGAESLDILAALHDAVVLGVDVINMSLGTSAGFADPTDEDNEAAIYDSIRDAGIALVVAGSNDYSAAQSSTWGSTNLTSNPDSGVVGSPSSYTRALSVASIAGVKTKYGMANDETAVYFTESSDTVNRDHDFAAELLALKGNVSEYEFDYVTVPGIGNANNYSAIASKVPGKIALVRRGTTTFEEKAQTAFHYGALAVLVYNNVSGVISMSMGQFRDIPSASTTMDAGNILAARAEGKLKISKQFLAGPFMSDFSSWGVLPNLELKPEITAHGGEILSAVPGGYDRFSGTSMASPNMAGAVTLALQYIKENNPGISQEDAVTTVYQTMMSTATIAVNEENNPYSPRKQGAGLADIVKTVNTPAYLFIPGYDKTKLSLGDDVAKTGVYTMNFSIKNIRADALSYKPAPITFTETVSSDKITVAERAYLLNDTAYSYEVTGGALSASGSVQVAGHATAQIKVTAVLSAAAKEYLNKNFVNGMFVEGYVRLLAESAGVCDLNIPFVAFYGDWTQAPMFDATAYQVGDSARDPAIADDDKLKADVYASAPVGAFAYPIGYNEDGSTLYDEGVWGLGEFGYILPEGVDAPLADEDKSALSANIEGNYKLAGVYAGLHRAAKYMDYEVYNVLTGAVITGGQDVNVRKSYYNGGRVPGIVDFEVGVTQFGLVDNVKYGVRLKGYMDWAGTQNNLRDTFESTFYVDSEYPVVVEEQLGLKVEERLVNGVRKKYYTLQMPIFDNHYLQAYKLSTYEGVAADGTLVGETLFHDRVKPVYESVRGAINVIEYDITDYMTAINRNGEQLYLELIDYAKNTSSFRIRLPRVSGEELTFALPETGSTLKINQSVDLKTYLTADTAGANNAEWKEGLAWRTSDDAVAAVNNGVVTGLSAGTAVVTVVNAIGVTASVEIQVTAESQALPGLTEIRLSDTRLDLEVGQTGELWAQKLPVYNSSTVKLAWTTTSPVIRLTPDPDDDTHCYYRVLKESTAGITVRAASGFVSGTCAITVKNPYVMNGYMLDEYHGRGDENGVVTIPDDLGIIYIDQAAFAYNNYVTKVIIPEGVTDISYAAFYGMNNLREVVLPSTVHVLNEWAFGWCPSLEKINLNYVRAIGRLCFYRAPLHDVDLSNVLFVGDMSFYNNSRLSNADLSNAVYIGVNAFNSNIALTNLKLSPNAQIGEGAFAETTALRDLVIPAQYIGKNAFAGAGLTSVALTGDRVQLGYGAFSGNTRLTAVTFNGTCTVIGENAFGAYKGYSSTSYCTLLTSIVMPQGLQYIGDNAFVGSGLSAVAFPAGVNPTYFGYGAFDRTKLQAFTVLGGNAYLSTDANGVLYNADKTQLIMVPDAKALGNFVLPDSVLEIGANAFACANLTGFAAGAGTHLRTVGESAFEGSNVSSVVLPDTVKKIRPRAFAFVTGALAVTLPQGLEVIEYATFAGSTGLTGIALPPALREIGESAFQGSGLRSIVLPAGLQTVGGSAFYGCDYDGGAAAYYDLVIPAGVTQIGTYAFAGVAGIKSVTLPADLTELPAYAFYSAKNLATVAGGGKLAKVGNSAFAASGLTSVTLPDTVTSLGTNVFNGCAKLVAAYLPAGLTTLPAGTFKGCAVLSTLAKNGMNIPALAGIVNLPGVTTVGTEALSGCVAVRTMELPAAVTLQSKAFFGMTGVTTLTAPEATSVGGNLFADGVVNTTLTSVSLPKVKTVAANAFYNLQGLTTIALPALETLGASAFSGTAITSFALGAAVKTVAEGAFSGANGLTSFTVAAGNAVFFMEEGVLYRNIQGGYELVRYPASKTDTTYSIKAGTLRIAANAFRGNTVLYGVAFPASLLSVGAEAFYGCTGLAEVVMTSVVAPVLENFNKSEGHIQYANFIDVIGTVTGLTLFMPENGVYYNSLTYTKYFDSIQKLTDTALADKISGMSFEGVVPDAAAPAVPPAAAPVDSAPIIGVFGILFTLAASLLAAAVTVRRRRARRLRAQGGTAI